MNFCGKYLRCDYVLSIFLLVAFYKIGFIVADLVDFHFEEHDISKKDTFIVIELAIELSIALLIKFIFERYHKNILDPLYVHFGRKTPDIIYTLILITFVMGMHQSMVKANAKSNYLVEKYVVKSKWWEWWRNL
jgi:hypothetical protein